MDTSRILPNKKLCVSYSYVKSLIFKCAGNVTQIGKMRNTCRIFMWNILQSGHLKDWDWMKLKFWWWKMGGTNLGLCPIADFGNNDAESLGYSVRVLNTICKVVKNWILWARRPFSQCVGWEDTAVVPYPLV